MCLDLRWWHLRLIIRFRPPLILVINLLLDSDFLFSFIFLGHLNFFGNSGYRLGLYGLHGWLFLLSCGDFWIYYENRFWYLSFYYLAVVLIIKCYININAPKKNKTTPLRSSPIYWIWQLLYVLQTKRILLTGIELRMTFSRWKVTTIFKLLVTLRGAAAFQM